MGLTVRARDFGQSWVASWRAIGGGELPEFTSLLVEARHEVMGRMVADAQARGANAVIAMRFDGGDIGGQWKEVCAYGTAVSVRALGPEDEGATPQSIELWHRDQAMRHSWQERPAPPVDFQAQAWMGPEGQQVPPPHHAMPYPPQQDRFQPPHAQ